MKNFTLSFLSVLLFPVLVFAEPSFEPEGDFDALPITQSEINAVSKKFWYAKSIQDNVKARLPSSVKRKFTKSDGPRGCDIKGVTKSEGSADVCKLSEDPLKSAQFVYNFNLSCNFGSYKVVVCSHGENKLLNQVKVETPEKLVYDAPVASDFENAM